MLSSDMVAHSDMALCLLVWPLTTTTLSLSNKCAFRSFRKCLPSSENYDNTGREQKKGTKNCGHMMGAALWGTDRPWRNSPNINPSLSRGLSPTSENKEEPAPFPQCFLTDTHEQAALEAHIHPRGGVSSGISHTCQWIAHNSCTDTSELLVLGYNLPGSKLCNFCCFQANWKELKLAND